RFAATVSLVVLNRSRERVQQDLVSSITTGEDLLTQKPKSEAEVPDFRRAYLSWEARTEAILENSFKVSGFLTSSPKSEFTGTAVSLLDLKIASTTIPWERVSEVVTDIEEKLRVLESIENRLDIYNEIREEKSTRKPSHNAPIFLVH